MVTLYRTKWNQDLLEMKKKKKNFTAPFYGWGSTASRLEPLRGGNSIITTKSPEIPCTHFIDLGRVKGWVDARKLTITARSPDLNPIENIFHIVKQRLHQDALNRQITRKDFAGFSARVKTIPELIPNDVVDRTTLFLGRRINEIIKRKGLIIKY